MRSWQLPAQPREGAGAVRTVTTVAETGTGSLTETIAAAAHGDTIRFAVAGTINLTLGSLVIDKSLDIEGPGGPAAPRIQRSNAEGVENFRIFRIHNESSTLTVHLSNLTIANGAGVYCTDSSVTITNCLFLNNSAGNGGYSQLPGSSGGRSLHLQW